MAWFEHVLGNPEWTEKDSVDIDLEYRLGRIVEYQHRILRVIVNIKVTPARVVALYFDRRRMTP